MGWRTWVALQVSTGRSVSWKTNTVRPIRGRNGRECAALVLRDRPQRPRSARRECDRAAIRGASAPSVLGNGDNTGRARADRRYSLVRRCTISKSSTGRCRLGRGRCEQFAHSAAPMNETDKAEIGRQFIGDPLGRVAPRWRRRLRRDSLGRGGEAAPRSKRAPNRGMVRCWCARRRCAPRREIRCVRRRRTPADGSPGSAEPGSSPNAACRG